MVAVYAVALRLAEYQRRLCDQFSGMLFPVVMGLSGDRDALKRALIEGNRVAVTLVTGASVCLIGFSGPLIHRWMGPAFDGSVVPFVFLALAGFVVVSQAASSNVLIACGADRLVADLDRGSGCQSRAERRARPTDRTRRRRDQDVGAAPRRPLCDHAHRRLPPRRLTAGGRCVGDVATGVHGWRGRDRRLHRGSQRPHTGRRRQSSSRAPRSGSPT